MKIDLSPNDKKKLKGFKTDLKMLSLEFEYFRLKTPDETKLVSFINFCLLVV